MVAITKEFIDSIQIPTPSGLNELLDKILKSSQLRHDVDFMPDEPVPCLMYKEWIAGIGPPLYRPEKRLLSHAPTMTAYKAVLHIPLVEMF